MEIALLKQPHHASSILEGGITATGGALTLIKIFITMDLYRWKPYGTYIYGDPNDATPIHLFPDSVPEKINTVHPYTTKEILGVWQCASRNMDTQIEMLNSK